MAATAAISTPIRVLPVAVARAVAIAQPRVTPVVSTRRSFSATADEDSHDDFKVIILYSFPDPLYVLISCVPYSPNVQHQLPQPLHQLAGYKQLKMYSIALLLSSSNQ
jgi:hypothetical protein